MGCRAHSTVRSKASSPLSHPHPPLYPSHPSAHSCPLLRPPPSAPSAQSASTKLSSLSSQSANADGPRSYHMPSFRPAGPHHALSPHTSPLGSSPRRAAELLKLTLALTLGSSPRAAERLCMRSSSLDTAAVWHGHKLTLTVKYAIGLDSPPSTLHGQGHEMHSRSHNRSEKE